MLSRVDRPGAIPSGEVEVRSRLSLEVSDFWLAVRGLIQCHGVLVCLSVEAITFFGSPHSSTVLVTRLSGLVWFHV